MPADLAQLLDAARLEAQRRRHDSVGPEHLLAAILEEDAVVADLRQRSLDPAELRERLEARLSSRPTLGGYRDAEEAPPSPTLERVFERVMTDHGWLRSPPTVLDALLLEPWIASLVVGLRRGEDARHLLERASALAVVHGHAHIDLVHALATLLDEPFLEEALAAVGADRGRLREVLAVAMGRQRTASEPRVRPDPTPALARVVVAPSSMRRFAVKLLREQPTTTLVEEAGIDTFRLLYALTHRGALADLPAREATSVAATPGDARVDVVAHSDGLTTAEEVSRVLEPAFELSPAQAFQLTSVMRSAGSAVVATLPLVEASRRRARAFEHMRREGIPLRLTLRRH